MRSLRSILGVLALVAVAAIGAANAAVGTHETRTETETQFVETQFESKDDTQQRPMTRGSSPPQQQQQHHPHRFLTPELLQEEATATLPPPKNNLKKLCDEFCNQKSRPKIKVSGALEFQLLVDACSKPALENECPENLRGVPLNCWDVSGVTDMQYAFYFHESFNEPLECWDVSNVKNMKDMFHNATVFNQPLNNWNVSAVTSMRYMFRSAPVFNQPLNNWDVSGVMDFKSTFYNATSFNQCLNRWSYFSSHLAELRYIFEISGCSNKTTPDPNSMHPWCGISGEDPDGDGKEGASCPRLSGPCADLQKTFKIRKNKKKGTTCRKLESWGAKKIKLHCSKNAFDICPSVCTLRCSCGNKKTFKVTYKGHKYRGCFKCKKVGLYNNVPTCETRVNEENELTQDFCPERCDYCLPLVTKENTRDLDSNKN